MCNSCEKPAIVCVCVSFFWWCSNKINFLFTDFYELWRRRRYLLRFTGCRLLWLRGVCAMSRLPTATSPIYYCKQIDWIFFFQICFLEALSEGHYDFISFFFFSKYFHKIETSLLKLATFTGGTKNLLGFRPNDQQGESETSWPKRESKSFKCLLFKERKKNLSLGLFIVKRRNLLVVSISRITK